MKILDIDYYYDGDGVIQKPKVTVFKIKKKDTVVLKCDGVVDSIEESEALEVVKKSLEESSNIASDLVLSTMSSVNYNKDNVTVVAITVN